ncbi:MAG: class I SAM-dependent methyltransferase [Candidatus Adiutrix sp.]|jgi:SAM-dependent methyltransferase|nr:class I SAM-dependent methyltransferase [Candidatus Adiutrix sp.]
MDKQWRQGRDFFIKKLEQLKKTTRPGRRLADDAWYFEKKSVVDQALPHLREIIRQWTELPRDFEPEFYQSLYPENGQGQKAEDFFRNEGPRRGELASPIAHMLGLTGFLMNDASVSTVLEIGPYAHPLDLGPGVTVKRFDLLDQNDLIREIEGARTRSHVPDEAPFIDYVSPVGDLSIINEEFDALYSAHCLEHTPDLIGHLDQAAALLRPGGRYYLIIPDHRYCFDHFYPPTELNQITTAEGRFPGWVHYATAYFNQVLITHNDPERHWRGDHFNDGFWKNLESRIKQAEENIENNGGPWPNAHNWRFNPALFRRVMNALRESGRLKMEIKRVGDTPAGRCEFTAVLEKPGARAQPAAI